MATPEHILILGGGIAGAGLARNLRRLGYRGRTTLLDRESPGSARAYGYRNTFREVIEEYSIPFVKTFRGLRDGVTDGAALHWCDIDVPCYFFDYAEACKALLSDADAVVLHGEPIDLDIGKRILKHSGGEIAFDFLVDCTGHRAWTRSRLNLPLAGKFYVGKTGVMPLPPVARRPGFFVEDRFIYYTEDNGYMEDVYAIGDTLLFGAWNYFSSPTGDIQLREGGILGAFADFPTMRAAPTWPAAIVAEPVYPIVFGPVAYLGDSCGQATPASSEGTRPILEASRLLAECLLRGDLASYQGQWFKKNGMAFAFHKCLKDDMPSFNRLFARLRTRPDIYRDLVLNKSPWIPVRILLPSLPYLSKTLAGSVKQHLRNRRRLRSDIAG